MVSLEPPKGGDQHAGHVLLIVASTTFALALITVCLRMYARARVVRAVGWDDWVMLLAILSAFLALIVEIIGVKKGLGRHEFYLTPPERAGAGKYSAFSVLFCITALNIGKISACISLLRILDGTNKKSLRQFLIFMIFIQFVVNVVVCTTLFVQCRPTRKVWTPTLPGSCWKPTVQQNLNYLQAALSCATDFLLAGLPIYIIRDLQLSKFNKTLLSILMGFGCITGILAIVRSIYLEPYAKTADPSWTNVGLLTWGGVERNTGIIVASLPFIRPIFQTPFMKSVLSLGSHSKSHYHRRSGYSMHPDESHGRSTKLHHIDTKDSNQSNTLILDDKLKVPSPAMLPSMV